MMKIRFACLGLGLLLQCGQLVHAASAEQYVLAVEKINENYKQDTRTFLNTLNPMQRGFSAEQQADYCKILGKYADDLYSAADENRAFIDSEYRNMNKQDVVQQVMASKEMQLLKKYNVQCTLN